MTHHDAGHRPPLQVETFRWNASRDGPPGRLYIAACLCYALGKMDEKNKLYFGDNLKILREYVPDASVDLICLDPPFNSSATYNVLFKEKSGEESAAQITAFEDTWGWGLEPEAVYKEIVTSGPRKLADLMQALLAFLGRNDMMAYLVVMPVHLVESRRAVALQEINYRARDTTAAFCPWRAA
jgi:site-specific DNA-methyltransferase (adenine-specific)